ncbi:hypothetical protein [Neoroseomonas rubea]|uniref:hypothetical protein n=1 Tax=Neoroseomonas rubea TaxID=2748666 RepID=UPI0018DEFE0C|nr:hypothetical protein [Roseomonas rubea]
MTACEVMTWIGLGQALDFSEYDRRVDLLERWGPGIDDDAVLALDARAGEAPSCTVVRVIEGSGEAIGYRSRYFSPSGPKALRHLRAWRRRYLGRLVTYREMAVALRSDMLRAAEDERAVEAGRLAMLAELQRGSLIALGRLETADGKAAAVPTAIPLTFWANRWHTIAPQGRTTLAPGAPFGELLASDRPRWREVQFATKEVLAIWPPGMTSTAPPVPIDAPSHLSWFQAVTWIATGGDVIPHHDTHPDLIWQRPITRDGEAAPLPPPYIMTPDDAQKVLVRSLALGELECLAIEGPERPAIPEGPSEIVPAHRWPFLHPDRGVRTSHPEGVTYLWFSATCCYWRPKFRSVDVVKLWLPARTPHTDAKHVYRTGAPGRPTSGALVLAELRRRGEQGQVEPTLAAEARALSAWLQSTHSEAAQLRPRAMENTIRNEYRRVRSGRDAIK